MSFVEHRGSTKKVKNLGWLLRHSLDIEEIAVTSEPPFMAVKLRGDKTYKTEWADPGVMMDWLLRPNFMGAILSIDGIQTRVGHPVHLVRMDPSRLSRRQKIEVLRVLNPGLRY